MTCDEARLCLGAYALGSLDAGEDGEVRAHVENCAVCQQEMREIEGLPALLAELTIEEASGRVQPSPELYESLRARAVAEEEASRRPRNHWLTLTAAAAVAVLALVGGTVAWQEFRHGPTQYSGSNQAVHMSVELQTRTTGTGLRVKVRGLPANEHCTLIAIGAGGAREVAGSWVATYEGEAVVTGWTALSITQLTDVQVVDGSGKELVNAKV